MTSEVTEWRFVMVIIALIMAIVKILLDLFLFIIKIINQRKYHLLNSDGVGCIYLQKKDNKNICANIICHRKMIEGICPRQKCYGFVTGKVGIADIEVINYPPFKILKKIVDLFPEFAAALLALNEIIF